MDLGSRIDWARQRIQDLPEALPWRESVLNQLSYCKSVASGSESSERLESLTMGVISVREMDDSDEVASAIRAIQYELQQQYLTYAAKVRLGIQKR
jgi:hypothetical protein